MFLMSPRHVGREQSSNALKMHPWDNNYYRTRKVSQMETCLPPGQNPHSHHQTITPKQDVCSKKTGIFFFLAVQNIVCLKKYLLKETTEFQTNLCTLPFRTTCFQNQQQGGKAADHQACQPAVTVSLAVFRLEKAQSESQRLTKFPKFKIIHKQYN